MIGFGRVLQPGDAVRYCLPDNTWLYGLVEAVRPLKPSSNAGNAAAVAWVAFPVTDFSSAPTRAECDPDLLLPLRDPELRAFLAANTHEEWSHPQLDEMVDSALQAAPAARWKG